jgi:hypothetical protein
MPCSIPFEIDQGIASWRVMLPLAERSMLCLTSYAANFTIVRQAKAASRRSEPQIDTDLWITQITI